MNLIEQLEELKIKEGKTYYSDSIIDLDTKALHLVPTILTHLRAAQKLRDELQGDRFAAYCCGEHCRGDCAEETKEDIDQALAKFDKSINI